MGKKFKELTVRELGEVLNNGYANVGTPDADEYQRAQELLKGVTTLINTTPGFSSARTIHVCTVIYPFYYIYKYATDGQSEDDALDEAKELCEALSGAEQTTMPPEKTWDLLKKQWQDWWDGHPDYAARAKGWLEMPLILVGEAIHDTEGLPNPYEMEWVNFLEEITIKHSSTFHDTADYIKENVSQFVLTGAPGTGKTKVAKELAFFFGSYLTWEPTDENGVFPRYKLVQFHPSYDYTDFVEGLRPVEIGTELTFKKVDGIFKHFCRNVVEEGNSAQKYFFIIDEINRADLSKVFGELMYCLEKDKRGKENRIDTQYQNLSTYTEDGTKLEEDVFAEGFFIPENVTVIGTMNDIDRSVESMDMALRRRFVWHEVEVDADLLEESLRTIFSDAKGVTSNHLAKRIDAFNQFMVAESEKNYYGLNKHYYISQGQFTDLLAPGDSPDLDDILAKAWSRRIKGLIEEYVRGEDGADEYVNECEQAFLQTGKASSATVEKK